MGRMLGLDMGASTTKIVVWRSGVTEATLQIPSVIENVEAAIQSLLTQNQWDLKQIEKIVLTGVGASRFPEKVGGIPTIRISEFEAIGRGGLALSGYDEALVVSVGTGTAFVNASKEGFTHIGGSGIGGGTLLGLSERLLGENQIERIVALAKNGNLDLVDLTVGDISLDPIPGLLPNITAANFGKLSPCAKREDLALGLLNLLFQTVGVMAAFACKNGLKKQTVVIGSLAAVPQARTILEVVGKLHDLCFLIPEQSAFAAAIGAILLAED